MDAPTLAGKCAARSGRTCGGGVVKGNPVPPTSTESRPRCRQCGAPLVGAKRRRTCPRCHPEDAAGAAQMEFTLATPSPPPEAPAVPAEVVRPAMGPPPEIARSREPSMRVRQPWSASRFLSFTAGSLIVVSGLSWAGFQLWPRGSVERSIVEALAALPRFTERTSAENPFATIAVEGDSSPSIFDFNGDGLPDLVTGSRSGEIRVFRNSGTRTRPRFTRAAADTAGLVPTDTANTVAFAHLRGADTADALNAGTNGSPTFFQNRGTHQKPDFVLLAPEDDPFAVAAAPAHSLDWRPTFADIDHDGDIDLFVGTRDGSILFFENRGTPQKPQFQGVTRIAPFGLRGVGDLVSLCFGDLDGDGDLDAIAGNAAGDLLFLHNRGNAWRPKFEVAPRGALGLPTAGRDATVALADLDGDGDLDCVVGGADGHFRYFENLSTPVPVKPETKR